MQISPWMTSCQILLWITVQVLSVLRNINCAEHNKRKVLVQSLTEKLSKWFKPAFKCIPKVLNSHRDWRDKDIQLLYNTIFLVYLTAAFRLHRLFSLNAHRPHRRWKWSWAARPQTNIETWDLHNSKRECLLIHNIPLEYLKILFSRCQFLQKLMSFLISNFRRVLKVVCFLLGNSLASEFYMPTFRNILSVPSS